MPLRIILRFCVFFSLAAACLLPVGCTPQESYSLQTRAALERLDAELAQKARYQQWRQEQADELRGRIDAKAPTAEQAEQVFAVAQVFVTFDLDSSAYYVDRLYRLSMEHGICVFARWLPGVIPRSRTRTRSRHGVIRCS